MTGSSFSASQMNCMQMASPEWRIIVSTESPALPIQLHLVLEGRSLQTVNGSRDMEIAGSCRFHSARAEPVSAELCEECQGFVPSVIEMWLYICKSFYASQLSREASPRDGQRSVPGLACTRPAAVPGQGQPPTLDAMGLSGPTTHTLCSGGKRPQNAVAFYVTPAADQPRSACSHVPNHPYLSDTPVLLILLISITPNVLSPCLPRVDYFQWGSCLPEACSGRHTAGVG